jgi:forkhead box protein K
MDSRTRTSTPALTTTATTAKGATTTSDKAASRQATPPPPQDKISAYYSLVFPHFTFYIQTLSITIGRRCAPNPSAASSSTSEQTVVDVDLGALKSVSRLHAKIEYDQDEDRFVLVVIGRNGAWVDGVWCASGKRAPLGERFVIVLLAFTPQTLIRLHALRSQIQIASRTFHFVLPPPPPPEQSPSPSSESSGQRARSPSVEVEVEVDVDVTSISPPSSQPSHSPILDYKPLAPSPDPPTPPPPPPPKIKRDPQPELPNSNNIGKSNKSNPKKRKKGETEPPPPVVRPRPEDIPPKPPFTYAQLIYRSIMDIGGKATLQEICNWIMTTHEYYRWADGAWMVSHCFVLLCLALLMFFRALLGTTCHRVGRF